LIRLFKHGTTHPTGREVAGVAPHDARRLIDPDVAAVMISAAGVGTSPGAGMPDRGGGKLGARRRRTAPIRLHNSGVGTAQDEGRMDTFGYATGDGNVDAELREFLRRTQRRIRPDQVARRRQGLRAVLARALITDLPAPSPDVLLEPDVEVG
jgi:hypothetical protein